MRNITLEFNLSIGLLSVPSASGSSLSLRSCKQGYNHTNREKSNETSRSRTLLNVSRKRTKPFVGKTFFSKRPCRGWKPNTKSRWTTRGKGGGTTPRLRTPRSPCPESVLVLTTVRRTRLHFLMLFHPSPNLRLPWPHPRSLVGLLSLLLP